jgi:hypothetical protein
MIFEHFPSITKFGTRARKSKIQVSSGAFIPVKTWLSFNRKLEKLIIKYKYRENNLSAIEEIKLPLFMNIIQKVHLNMKPK